MLAYNNKTIIPVNWRKKLLIRSQSWQLLKKGKLTKQRCQICLEYQTKMTHVDYDDPMHVIWLCNKHYYQFQKLRKAERSS